MKSTGIAVGGLAGISNGVAARGAGDDGNECAYCPNVIEETDEYKITAVSNEGGAYLFRADKRERTVALLDHAQTKDQLDTDVRVSPYSHDLIDDWDWDSYTFGSCNGYVYDTHRAAVIGVETGESLDGIPEAGLSAAICGIGGIPATGPGAIVFAVGCGVGWHLLFDHVDLIDADVSVGGWDNHVGVLGEEAVQFGAANAFTTDHSELIPGDHAKGLHLGGGDDVADIVDEIISLL